MLENIRRIGIFMIVAQTVIHFAAGRQYEKYMKIIAGVIILLQFIAPFVSASGEIVAKWQAEAEQMMSYIESRSNELPVVSYGNESIQKTVVQQVEKEVKTRLNNLISGNGCTVTDVVIDLEEAAEDAGREGRSGTNSWVFRRVEVTLLNQERDAGQSDAGTEGVIRSEGEVQPIHIDEIVVGRDTQTDEGQEVDESQEKEAGQEAGTENGQDVQTQKYRKLFAQALGITEDRVEVIERGGW